MNPGDNPDDRPRLNVKSPMMQLRESIKRSIETTLMILDEALCQFEEWAQGRERRAVFYQERNNLSEAQRTEILSEITRMRDIFRELQDDLGLEGRVRGVANHIWGTCAVLAVNLEEIKGKYLSRYGKPPRELVAYLDPRIERLIAAVNHIFRLVEKSRI
jgi:hypothetical protein